MDECSEMFIMIQPEYQEEPDQIISGLVEHHSDEPDT